MKSNPAIMGLVDFLTATQEFSEMRHTFNELNANPGYMARLRQFQIFSEQASQADISREYAVLAGIPDIARYLRASEKYGAVFNEVMTQLTSAIQDAITVT